MMKVELDERRHAGERQSVLTLEEGAQQVALKSREARDESVTAPAFDEVLPEGSLAAEANAQFLPAGQNVFCQRDVAPYVRVA